MAIADYYKTLTLRKKTSTSDNRGGSVLTDADTTFSGLLTFASSQELELARKMAINATHTLYCPTTLDINRKDLVIDNGLSYRVVGYPQNTVNRNHHYKVMMELTVQ